MLSALPAKYKELLFNLFNRFLERTILQILHILNKYAFNNTFQSIFHLAFETFYSDFLQSDYKQIISDNKEKDDCA